MGKYDQYKEGRSGGYGKASYRSLCESEQGSELTTTTTKKALGEIVQSLNCLPCKYENLSFDPKHAFRSCDGEWKQEDLWSLLASQSN